MKIFCRALVISFLGSLPAGTLNLSVADLVIHQGIKAAAIFSIAAVVVEVTAVGVAIMVIGRLAGFTRLRQLFHAVACLLLFTFAYISLMAAWRMKQVHIAPPFIGRVPFLAGLLLSAANPLQVPFWMGWTATLKARHILADRYAGYLAGIAVGTWLAFLLYGVLGSKLVALLSEEQYLLNWVIGGMLLVMGLAYFYKYFLLKRIA